MKKKLLALLLVILSFTFLFASCGKDSDVPDGMKLASDTDIVDYKLFVPEDWKIDTVSTTTSTMAHVSDSDRSNIIVNQWNLTGNLAEIDDWWEKEYKPNLINSLGVKEEDISIEGEELTLDGKTAKRYEFSCSDLGDDTYKFMVVATKRKASIYVIQYTSTEDNYDKHLDDVEKILDNIRFI